MSIGAPMYAFFLAISHLRYVIWCDIFLIVLVFFMLFSMFFIISDAQSLLSTKTAHLVEPISEWQFVYEILNLGASDIVGCGVAFAFAEAIHATRKEGAHVGDIWVNDAIHIIYYICACVFRTHLVFQRV